MKILFVSDAQSIHTRRWAEYFCGQGCSVHIASFRPASIDGVNIHLLPTFGLGKAGYLLTLPKLRQIYRYIRPDIVHAQYVTSYGFLSALAGLKPLVLTAWGSDILLSPKKLRLIRFFASYATRHADALIAVAEHMIPSFYLLGAAQNSVEIIPDGVDMELFRLVPDYMPSEPVRIISTRSFSPIYDVQTLITALGFLKQGNQLFEADIIGDGSLRETLETQARSLGLSEQVRFHGYVSHDRLPALLASSDIYVTSALSDGNSVSLNEAMACGCFPIGARIPANMQSIEHGQNGLLYEPGNAVSLAEKLFEGISMRPRWAEIRSYNRKIVETRADWKMCTQKMEAIYQRLISM